MKIVKFVMRNWKFQRERIEDLVAVICVCVFGFGEFAVQLLQCYNFFFFSYLFGKLWIYYYYFFNLFYN